MSEDRQKLPESYYKLMHEMQAVDFVLVELNLYLDTHPDDLEAIQQYNFYAHKKQALKHQFETEFGSLQNFGQSYSHHPFGWKEEPWPWQV